MTIQPVNIIAFITLGVLLTGTLSQNLDDQGNQGFIPFIVNSRPVQQQSTQSRFPVSQQQSSRFQQPANNEIQPQNQQFQQQQPQQTPQNNQQILQQAPQNKVEPEKSMSDSCLACICQASTNCKLSTPCVGGGQYCGPFLISKPYWIDSGRITLIDDVPERDGAYESCALDPVCSASVVRRYSNKFQKDCNADREISCDDFARIHLMGPFDCSNQSVLNTPFYRKFRQCWNRVLQLSA